MKVNRSAQSGSVFPPCFISTGWKAAVDWRKSLGAPPPLIVSEWITVFVPLAADDFNGAANPRGTSFKIWAHSKSSMQVLTQLSSTGGFNVFVTGVYTLKTTHLFAAFRVLNACFCCFNGFIVIYGYTVVIVLFFFCGLQHGNSLIYSAGAVTWKKMFFLNEMN